MFQAPQALKVWAREEFRIPDHVLSRAVNLVESGCFKPRHGFLWGGQRHKFEVPATGEVGDSEASCHKGETKWEANDERRKRTYLRVWGTPSQDAIVGNEGLGRDLLLKM